MITQNAFKQKKRYKLKDISVGQHYLRRQFRRKVSSEVILRCDQSRRVVHFDLQVGKRIQERRVGHWNFV